MNIPLDRLYHYIENIAGEIYEGSIIIYRFFPHGSKNISNLTTLHDNNWVEKHVSPVLWCNDQEPLDYEFYAKQTQHAFSDNDSWMLVKKSVNLYLRPKNLNRTAGIFEKDLLLHSEQRSSNLKKYYLDNELIPVYYWSHGIIARDWFRYAEHETFQKTTKKMFLIYNRAWEGTREYRLRFCDLLIEPGLISYCQISCNVTDPDLKVHYSDYAFKNTQWRPSHQLENFLLPTTADATSSANFNTNDYNSTDIEVVLETLFDDSRLHLTEKSLRPIACGQPFILAGTYRSLEYLRSYGFKTFDLIWDESYDQLTDPEQRLIAVVNLMQKISTWDESTKKTKLLQAQKIADYNRQWFFSQEFFNLIVNELKTNLQSAFNELEQCNNYKPWIDRWSHLKSYPGITGYLETSQGKTSPTVETVNIVMKIAQNKLAKKSKISNTLSNIK